MVRTNLGPKSGAGWGKGQRDPVRFLLAKEGECRYALSLDRDVHYSRSFDQQHEAGLDIGLLTYNALFHKPLCVASI